MTNRWPRSASDRAFPLDHDALNAEPPAAAADAGVSSVSGWILLGATGVSADGTVIVGEGINHAKQREAFRAVVPRP